LSIKEGYSELSLHMQATNQSIHPIAAK